MLYLIFGADDFACSEALRVLESKLWSDPSLGELNKSVLDGRRLTLSELRHHGDALPFLAERRLVIVEGLVTRLEGKARERPASEEPAAAPAEDAPEKSKDLLEQLLAYLPDLPPTTDLVLLDVGLESRDSRGRIAKWAGEHGGSAREYPRQRPEELANWIRDRAKALGGSIEPRAAAHLAQLAGDDTRTLANELEKLILYADAGRPVSLDDVTKLTPHSRETNIFAIVDAVGERRWAQALADVRRLLEEGQHPLAILTMLARQYRLLIQAKAWSGAGVSPTELGRKMGVTDWVAKKALAQAGRYTPQQLRAIYDRLAATDLAIKTGQMDAPLALELFVAGADSPARP